MDGRPLRNINKGYTPVIAMAAGTVTYTSDAAIALIVVLALVSIGVGVLSTILYQRISAEKDVAMAQFQLVPEQTAYQFKVMFGGGLVMLAGLLIYVAGAVLEHPQFLLLGRASFASYAVIIAYVIWQWWRRL